MNRKKGLIGFLVVVLVVLGGFLVYKNTQSKTHDEIKETRYTRVEEPTQDEYSVVLEDKTTLTSAEYKEYIVEKGFENVDGNITLIESIQVKTKKEKWNYKVTSPEVKIQISKNGSVLNSTQDLSVTSEKEFEAFEIGAVQERFGDPYVFSTDAIEVTNDINFEKPGSYSIKVTVTDEMNTKYEMTQPIEVKESSKVVATDEMILVNRQNGLTASYIPNVISIYDGYTQTSEFKATPNTVEAFKKMVDAMYEETGLWMLATSAYRSYEYQVGLYNTYVSRHGEEEANRFSAKAGFSEHQTGLAIDVITEGKIMDDFGTTEQSKWVNENAHRFGFIVRYPEGKEDVTGYMPEAWHLRFLGTDGVAEDVYNSGLTYDEWYAQNVE